MTHDEIISLWKKQRDQYQAWQIALRKTAELLRKTIEELLQPPAETWLDTQKNKNYRYIDLVDISKKDKPRGIPLSSESITPTGELVFGLGITLDHGVTTYPKSLFHIPVAIRFINKQPEYSLFNTDTWASEKWEKDLDKFCQTILSEIVQYLSFDPFDGQKKTTSIGFI